MLRLSVPHSESASQNPPAGTRPESHVGVCELTGGLMAAHSDGAIARKHTPPVRPWHDCWPTGQLVGGAGFGGGGDGVGGGGGEIATGLAVPQMMKPPLTIEPSEYQVMVVPPRIW